MNTTPRIQKQEMLNVSDIVGRIVSEQGSKNIITTKGPAGETLNIHIEAGILQIAGNNNIVNSGVGNQAVCPDPGLVSIVKSQQETISRLLDRLATMTETISRLEGKIKELTK